jgi:hypothetical protein
MEFFGHDMRYWAELQQQLELKPDGPELEDLIQQNAMLRAKVSYYEQQIDRLMAYRKQLAQ